jgi:hypothetical protein
MQILGEVTGESYPRLAMRQASRATNARGHGVNAIPVPKRTADL